MLEDRYRQENTDRLRIREKLAVDLIDRREVVHVRQEDVDFDCFSEARAASLEDGRTSGESQYDASMGYKIPPMTMLLTGSSRLVPDKVSEMVRFLSDLDSCQLTALSATVPSTISPVAGSVPTCPEQ